VGPVSQGPSPEWIGTSSSTLVAPSTRKQQLTGKMEHENEKPIFFFDIDNCVSLLRT
jgi:hypothetical protein